MTLLAIDTCMAACSVAVVVSDDAAGEPVAAYETPGRGHAELIMPMIVRAMARADCPFGELRQIAVTVGPGSFSGVRVGIAAARGLALATGADVLGFTSLAVMAEGARRMLEIEAERNICVVHDAHRGQVYFGRFTAGGRVSRAPLLASVADAAALIEKGELAAGSGARLIASVAPDRALDCVLPELLPDARDLARMAHGAKPEDYPASPLYLRPPDAKPQTGKAVPRRT